LNEGTFFIIKREEMKIMSTKKKPKLPTIKLPTALQKAENAVKEKILFQAQRLVRTGKR